MKALINDQKTLKLVDDLPEPAAKKGEVLVRVHSASLNPTDLHIAQGQYDFLLRLAGAKSQVRTGLEFAGTVLLDSEYFKKGDRVYGYTHLLKGPKTHQQILSINENYVAPMPEGVSFEQGAAMPIALQTSYVALKRLAKLQAGQRVLINGASGGVGVYAIQLAKHLGAQVTAVAGPSGQGIMSEMGADTVLDYREVAIENLSERFHVILDFSAQYKFKDLRHLLTERGVFIPADPLKNWSDFLMNPLRQQKAAYLYVDRGDHKLLTQLAAWFDEQKLRVFDGQLFQLADYEQAITAMAGSGKKGRIVLQMAE